MASRADITERLTFRRQALAQAREAYSALMSGGVQQYTIGSRSLTRLDLSMLKAEIKELEEEIDGLTAQLNGAAKRKAVGVVPRDW